MFELQFYPFFFGKNNNEPPTWEWFMPLIYGDLGDGLNIIWLVVSNILYFP